MGTPQLPEEGAAGPAFAHLYIVDPNAANNMRLNFSRLQRMKFATSLTKRSESTIKLRRFSNAQCKIQAKRTNHAFLFIYLFIGDQYRHERHCRSTTVQLIRSKSMDVFILGGIVLKVICERSNSNFDEEDKGQRRRGEGGGGKHHLMEAMKPSTMKQ